MKEDHLTAALIQMSKEKAVDTDPDPEVRLEVGYNNYGDRGSVDIFVQQGKIHTIYEVKSESAIRQATGANEIIRQYNRHCRHFYPGSDFSDYGKRIQFELSLLPSKYTMQHVLDNADLYRECIANPSTDELRADSVTTSIYFRHPQNIHPVHLFHNDGVDFRDWNGTPGPWSDHVEEVNSEVWNEIADVVPDGL